MTDFTAYLRLGVDSRDAVKAQKNLDDMARSADRAGDKADSFGRTASRAFGIVASAAAGLAVVGIGKFISETKAAEQEQAQLTAVLRSTGEAAGFSRKALNEMADSMEAISAFSGGDITTAQTSLLAFTGIVGNEFPRALNAAADMAARTGLSIAQTSETIGRALDVPSQGMAALSKQGFRFSEDQKWVVKQLEATGRAAEAQDIILDALEDTYGGAAVAARDTFGGSLSALNNTISYLLTGSDGSLTEATKAINDFNDVLRDPATKEAVDSLGGAMARLAGGAVTVATEFADLGDKIGFTLAYLGGNLSEAIELESEIKNIDKALSSSTFSKPIAFLFTSDDELKKLREQKVLALELITGLKEVPPDPFAAINKSLGELVENSGLFSGITEVANEFSAANIESARAAAELAAQQKKLDDIRAESVARSIADLEKQNALFGDQSKYAEILYDINNALVIVTESEKARYLAAAQANDQLNANKNLADSIESFAKRSAEDKKELDSLIESVDEFGGAWTRTGSIVADALGGIADSLNDYSAKMVTIAKKEAQLAEQRKKFIGDPKEIAKISAAEKKLASERTSANISSYRQIAGAAASMFDEQSKARELLNKAEQAFAAVEIALALKKAAANALTAVTNQGGGDPYTAFGRIAAMAAIMAGLGLAVSGGGGGGSGPSAADIQKAQGTGTILGDAEGKSESIVNAFDNYEDIALDQLSELRGIRDAMTGLSSGIARLAVSLVSTNRFSGAEVSGLGTTLKDGSGLWGSGISSLLEKTDILGLNSRILSDIFGSTKRKLTDSGLQIGAQDMGDILAGDLSVFYYNTIETTKKKWWGLSKKTSSSDELSGADAALVDQFDQIFTFIGSVVTESLDVLGVESASAIESFKVNIGKISFKDLSGEEIQSELNAIFSQQADLIAEFVVPAMKEYQQIGEGLFETLTRVAKETATFNYYTENLGLNFNATGLAAIAAQQAIAEFSGGMDKLSASLASYYEEFFSDEERAANQMKLLSAELQKLGFDSLPESREAFRALVEGIDLTTAAGQKQFAALIELSGAFAELVPATEATTDAIGNAAKTAFDVLSKSVAAERARLQAILGGVNTAQTALKNSVNAEQAIINDAHKQRMASLNAEKTAAQALQQAQLAAINEQRQAVQSNISALTSLSNGLIDTIYDLSAESSALTQSRFSSAANQVSGALAAARNGQLPMNGELDRVLSALTSNQGGFASTFDAEFQTAAVQLELAELAKLTDLGLSAEERSLAQLDRQASAAESYYARSLQSIDKRMAQAEAFHTAETENLQAVLIAAQAQVDAINGVNSSVASVASAVTGFNSAVADVVANDAVNELSSLDDLLVNAEGQWNALQGIETGVAVLNTAMENFSRAITDANTAAGNAEVTELKLLLEEMRQTRKETAEAEARTQALLKGIVLYSQTTAQELQDQRRIAEANA